MVVLVACGTAVAQAFGPFTYSVLLPAIRNDLDHSNTIAGLLGTATWPAGDRCGGGHSTPRQTSRSRSDAGFTIVFVIAIVFALCGSAVSTRLPHAR